MKKILSNKWLQYYIPLTLLLFSCLTIKRVVSSDDGGYDRLYGLPFSYITGNVGCTGCYEVYVVPMFFDLLIYLIVILLLFKVVEKTGLNFKTHWIPGLIGTIISGLIIIVFLTMPDETVFKMTNNIPYKTISKELIWGF